MSDTPKKRAFIVRSFNVEGTGERFQKGSTPLIDAGAYGNYEAAGLVTAPPATKAARATKGKPKPKATTKPVIATAKAATAKRHATLSTATIPVAQPVPAPVVDQGSADA